MTSEMWVDGFHNSGEYDEYVFCLNYAKQNIEPSLDILMQNMVLMNNKMFCGLDSKFILDDLPGYSVRPVTEHPSQSLNVVMCLSVTNLIPSRTHLDFMQIFVIPRQERCVL